LLCIFSAAEYYKKALTFQNDDLDILLRICDCYRHGGKMDLAWEFHEKAKELHPKTFKVMENEVNLLFEMNDIFGCLRTCNEGRFLFNDAKVFLIAADKVFIHLFFVCVHLRVI